MERLKRFLLSTLLIFASTIMYAQEITGTVVDETGEGIIGDPNPDFGMGLTLTANYKNWSLSTFFSGEFGFDIYNGTRKQLEFMTYGNLLGTRPSSPAIIVGENAHAPCAT